MCRKDQSQIHLCGYLQPEIAPKQRPPTEFNWTCYLVQLYMITLSPCLALQLYTKATEHHHQKQQTFLFHQMIKMNRVFSSFSWHMSRRAHGPDDASFYTPVSVLYSFFLPRSQGNPKFVKVRTKWWIVHCNPIHSRGVTDNWCLLG